MADNAVQTTTTPTTSAAAAPAASEATTPATTVTPTVTPDAVVPEYIAGTWDIDPVHSEVTIAVRHMLVNLRGAFTRYSGQIVTAERIEDSSVDVTIDTFSFTSGYEKRDEKIRAIDHFLFGDKYPEIRIESKRIVPTGNPGEFTIDLAVTMRGVTNIVPMTTQLIGFASHKLYGTRIGLTGTASFDRRDFGVLPPKDNFVASSVELGDDNRLLGFAIEVAVTIEAALTTDRGPFWEPERSI